MHIVQATWESEAGGSIASCTTQQDLVSKRKREEKGGGRDLRERGAVYLIQACLRDVFSLPSLSQSAGTLASWPLNSRHSPASGLCTDYFSCLDHFVLEIHVILLPPLPSDLFKLPLCPALLCHPHGHITSHPHPTSDFMVLSNTCT